MATQHEAGLVICVTGPESTGKTTLARALAAHFEAPLVEEAARAYLVAGQAYDADDVLAIARLQQAWEAAAAAGGRGLVIADTDLSVVRVWWREKYGALHPWLREALANRSPRRYLLTLPDLPWAPDPLRESPHDRERLLLRYRADLAADGFPYAEIGGAGEERLARALEWVGDWIAST